MKADRAWVRLSPSGRPLNLLQPDPWAWKDVDLAVALSRTYRWGGHSAWDLPLSVAQHSLLVLAIRKAKSPTEISKAEQRRELLHDADEGFLSFDCIAPVKPHLGEGYAGLVERLQAAIVARYRLPDWTAEDHSSHKEADHLAAASEALHVVGWSRKEIQEVLEIEKTPLLRDPLAPPRGTKPWQPWPPQLAAKLFLAELSRLTVDLNFGAPPVQPAQQEASYA